MTKIEHMRDLNESLEVFKQALSEGTGTTYGSSYWAALADCEYKGAKVLEANKRRLAMLEEKKEETEEEKETDEEDLTNLYLGTEVHALLALYHGLDPHFRATPEKFLDLVSPEAQRLFQAYLVHDSDAPLRGHIEDLAGPILTVDVELPLENIVGGYHIIGGYPYTTKLDLIYGCQNGTVIVDHKTRAQKLPDQPILRLQHQTDPQFLGQVYLAQQHETLKTGTLNPSSFTPPTTYHVWNAIIKTKKVKVERHTIEVTPEMAANWDKHQTNLWKSVIALKNHSCVTPRRNPKACWRWNRPCTWLQECWKT